MEKVKPINPQSEYFDSEIRLDENIKEFNIEDLPDSFFGMIVAPRRSGKSEKMSSLLERIKKVRLKNLTTFFYLVRLTADMKDKYHRPTDLEIYSIYLT